MATDLYSLIEQRPGHPNFGGPFYIGVGTKRRPRAHFAYARSRKGHPNPELQSVFAAHFAIGTEPAVRIIETFESQTDAFAAEIATIAKYGRMCCDPDGVLCNLSPGGEGLDSETAKAAWADPIVRARRIKAFTGVAKTPSAESLAARRANARTPRSAEALALQRAASERNWADPEFVAQRSRNQAAVWEDPQKRANMLEGRSEGIAQSWQDEEVREKRTTNISAAVANKWEQDPDYAARTRAGLRASWADPEKKAARVAKMLASRAEKGANRTAKGAARQSAVMTAVNASMSAEDRSIIQAKSWADPAVAAARKAGIQKAAQDPALKAARLAAMAAGKRRKAAERAVQSGGSG